MFCYYVFNYTTLMAEKNYFIKGEVKGKKAFSGAQPTGSLHIGNYLGAIKNWVELSKNNTCYFTIVDLHALSIHNDPDIRRINALDAAIVYLASGINIKNAHIYIQSHVKEHVELMWLLNSITPIAELERMTQFKDKKQKNENNINAALFTYPVLMAADILLFNADIVPVGEDQYQHVELTRTIARKFNRLFCEETGKPPYFTEPMIYEPIIPRVMSLSNPDKKMSKSDASASYIGMFDDPDIIVKKINRAVTETKSDGRGSMGTGVKNLIELLRAFGGISDANRFEQLYNDGVLQFSELKKTLAEHIINELTPIQKRRLELLDNIDEVKKMLSNGADHARKEACERMRAIKEHIGLIDDGFSCDITLPH